MFALLAQARPLLPWGWGFVEIAIAIVIIAAIVAIVWVALKQMGIAIPPWVVNVFWIIVVAFVCVLAIRIIASL